MTPGPYRVLVTGSRDWPDPETVRLKLAYALAYAESCGRPLLVTHGACPGGADRHADLWAKDMKARGRPVDVTGHPAQNHPTQDFGPWPGAGPKRNAYMVGLGHHLCLAFIAPCSSDRCSRNDAHPSHGASGCARNAEAAGIPTRRFIP